MLQTVAVLGGGVAGLSAAHELAERGLPSKFSKKAQTRLIRTANRGIEVLLHAHAQTELVRAGSRQAESAAPFAMDMPRPFRNSFGLYVWPAEPHI